jgi:molybdopterin-guanine dinucleotide biosynthesis protein A
MLGSMATICAAILAGGKSRRMGTNKALIPYRGVPLIRRVADCACSITDEVMICADEPDLYSFLKLPVVPDRFPGCGPLAGLHTAFLATERTHVLLLACDLPNLTASLLKKLVSSTEDFDAVIPVTSDNCAQPLCAVYARTCEKRVEENLVRGQYKIIEVFSDARLRTRYFLCCEMSFHDSLLHNLNTPDDLKKLVP